MVYVLVFVNACAYVCLYVCVCLCVCMYVCVLVCVHACTHVCVTKPKHTDLFLPQLSWMLMVNRMKDPVLIFPHQSMDAAEGLSPSVTSNHEAQISGRLIKFFLMITLILGCCWVSLKYLVYVILYHYSKLCTLCVSWLMAP